MLLLPTFNAVLRPCSIAASAFTDHEKGRFCGQCQRVVQDFSHSADPVADLAAARAASPDGRVCGSFRTAQVQAPPRLTQRLRWFVVALVLVVGQGLTAREAWAQVRHIAAPHRHTTTHRRVARPILLAQSPIEEMGIISGTAEPRFGDTIVVQPALTVYTYAERMPSLRGGGTAELYACIQQQLRRPADAGNIEVEGRVFVSFVVGVDGHVSEVQVVKGLHPLFDAEAVRAVNTLGIFEPGMQNGRPVPVRMVVPVSFKM